MRWATGVLSVAVMATSVTFGGGFAAGLPGQSDGQTEVDERLRAAVGRLDGGDALNAMLDLEGVLRRDPASWAAHYHLGRAQTQLGDDLGAKDSFIRAAELNPGLAQLHFMAAALAYRLAHFEAAWAQVVSASQSGYPVAQVQHLMKSLRQYSEAPPDLAERLAAPAVAVSVSATPEDAETISSVVRVALYREPRVAVTLDETRALYRLEITPGDEAELVARLVRVADGETVGESTLAADAGGAPSGVRALVDRITAWVGAPANAGLGR